MDEYHGTKVVGFSATVEELVILLQRLLKGIRLSFCRFVVIFWQD